MQNALKNKTKYITLKERFKGRSVSKWKQRTKKERQPLCLQCLALPLSASVSSELLRKKAYDAIRKSFAYRRLRRKDSEIDEAYQKFEKEEDRDKKLEALKQEMESAEQYKKDRRRL